MAVRVLFTISGDAVYANGGKDNDLFTLTSSKKHTIHGGAGADTINSNSVKALLIDGGADQDNVRQPPHLVVAFTQSMVVRVATASQEPEAMIW